jgi:hypothetical protein
MFPAGDGLPHPNHYEIWYNPRARRVGKIAVYNPHSFTIKTSRGTTYLVIARGANKVSFYRCDPPAALK